MMARSLILLLKHGIACMRRWTSFTLRALFIVGFLIVLPVMAMPQVAAVLDQLLYGETESSVPRVGAEKDGAVPLPQSTARRDESTASHVAPLDEDVSRASLERLSSSPPPPLRREPDFLSPPAAKETHVGESPSPADVGPLDQGTAAKIDGVRRRLEELGAEYVRLEMSEDGREFHCLCQMAVNNNPEQFQPFEATRNDPVAAAQAVLQNVETWRNAERAPGRNPVFRPR
jgi:hypothetical protein